jgi:hypothetical protein
MHRQKVFPADHVVYEAPENLVESARQEDVARSALQHGRAFAHAQDVQVKVESGSANEREQIRDIPTGRVRAVSVCPKMPPGKKVPASKSVLLFNTLVGFEV